MYKSAQSGSPRSLVEAGFAQVLVLLLLLVAIIILVVGVGGYFLYQKQATKPDVVPQRASQPTPSPIPNQTTNWKTYTNSEWHFQISYPSNWDFKEYEYNKNWAWLTSSYGRIDIGVRPRSEDNLEKEARVQGQSHLPECMANSPCEGLPAKEVQKKSDPKFKELYEVVDADDTKIIIFSLPQETDHYIEIRTVAKKLTGDVAENVSKKMLSTFKFIDQNKSNLDSNKSCNQDSDCSLLTCTGCFNKEWLKSAPPDLACVQYAGYSCKCTNNLCTAVK